MLCSIFATSRVNLLRQSDPQDLHRVPATVVFSECGFLASSSWKFDYLVLLSVDRGDSTLPPPPALPI